MLNVCRDLLRERDGSPVQLPEFSKRAGPRKAVASCRFVSRVRWQPKSLRVAASVGEQVQVICDRVLNVLSSIVRVLSLPVARGDDATLWKDNRVPINWSGRRCACCGLPVRRTAVRFSGELC